MTVVLLQWGWLALYADQKGEVLSANGERYTVDLPSSAFEGIPHDPAYQGGSSGLVMPMVVSTERFPAKPLPRAPFRQKEAPKMR